MKYRRMDAQGETLFGHGLSDFATGAEAVALAVRGRLLLLRGEWWEARDEGFPLFESIIGKRMTETGKRSASDLIRTRILGTSGVLSVDSLHVETEGRMLRVSCVITTAYGDAQVEVDF